MQHFKFVNWLIWGFVFWCHEQVIILGLLPEFKYCVAESQKGAKRFYLFVTKQHSIGNWNNAEVTGDCNLQFGRKSGPMCILFLVSYIIDIFDYWKTFWISNIMTYIVTSMNLQLNYLFQFDLPVWFSILHSMLTIRLLINS